MGLELVLGIWVCAFSSFWVLVLPLLLLLPHFLSWRDDCVGGTIVVLGWRMGGKNLEWNFWCFANYWY